MSTLQHGMQQPTPADFPVLITRPAGKADNLLAGLDELGIAYTYQPLITTQLMPLRGRDLP
jgi:uroporphyrinogen-III synthase